MPDGELSIILADASLSSTLVLSGNVLHSVLGDMSLAASAGILVAGSLSASLGAITLLSSGEVPSVGSLASTLDSITSRNFGIIYDGTTAPYEDIVSWTGHPLTGSLVRVRIGNLVGMFGQPNEFGLFAGEGWDASSGALPSASSKYIRLGSVTNEFHNVPINLYDNGVITMQMEPDAPSFAMGNPIPSGYATGAGLWQGKDTDDIYKWRIGDPSVGGSMLSWNGSSLSLVNSSLDIGGANAHLAFGDPVPTSPTSGTGIWIDKNGLYGINDGVLQIFIDTLDGRLYIDGGTEFGVSPLLGNLYIEGVLTLGTDGRLQQGTGTWGTNFTGSAIWNESDIMNIGGWNNNVKQWWGGSDGKFYADEGNITLDEHGMTVMSSGVDNVRISQNGVYFYNPTTDLYQNSSIAFISTSDPMHLNTVGYVFGYSNGYENFLEISGLGYDVYNGAVSNVEVRAMSYYNAHAKLAATMPGVGDDAYLSVNMADGSTAIATSIDLFADSVNVKNGVVTYDGAYSEYRGEVYTGLGEANVWKRVALVTIGTGTYGGASFKVEYVVGTSNWGQYQPITRKYDIRMVRSSNVEDNIDAAYIEGNDNAHLRVVKTATGVFEVQVRSGYQYSRNKINVTNITSSRATIDFGVATAGSGTTYTPTWNQANRVVTLASQATVYSSTTFTVGTTTTYDVNSYGIPTTARMVYIRTYSRWTSAGPYLAFSEYGTSNEWLIAYSTVANGDVHVSGWVGVDSSGRFNVRCSGATTVANCAAVILAYME